MLNDELNPKCDPMTGLLELAGRIEGEERPGVPTAFLPILTGTFITT